MTLIRFVEDKDPLRVIGIGVLCVGGGFFILPFGQGFAFAALSMVIWTIGEMLSSPVMSTYVANRTQDHNRGAYMGLFAMGFAAAYVVGPMAGSWVYQYFGGMTLWTVCLVISVLNQLGFEWLGRRDRLAAAQSNL